MLWPSLVSTKRRVALATPIEEAHRSPQGVFIQWVVSEDLSAMVQGALIFAFLFLIVGDMGQQR